MKPITADERETAFRMKLDTLLVGNGAEMEITDDGAGYGMQTAIVVITMPAIYNDDNELEKDFCEFEI